MTTFEASADIIQQAQDRLADLGYDDPSGDSPGVLGSRTSVALQAFQRQRGLTITGELDGETWNRLVEAGWHLGDRLLFLAAAALRGDDVAALQQALALLGFNPGRIDGIFGPLTEHALADFQRNCGLEATGVLTRVALQQLRSLASSAPDRQLVTVARDSTGVIADHRKRMIVVHGQGRLAALLVEQLHPALIVLSTGAHSDHEGAALANTKNAGLLLAIVESPTRVGVQIHYFESYRSHSVVGFELARAIANALVTHTELEVTVQGMALPILRETMMPALDIIVGANAAPQGDAIVAAIEKCAVLLFDKSR